MRIRINNTAKWKCDFQYTNAGEISEMSVFIKISVHNTALKLGKLITLRSNTNINKFP